LTQGTPLRQGIVGTTTINGIELVGVPPYYPGNRGGWGVLLEVE
jgi:hypothetical protein